MFKVVNTTVAVLLLTLNIHAFAEEAVNREPVLGRVILSDGGTSEHGYMMPVVYKPHGRHKVLLGYLSGSVFTGEVGLSFANRDADAPTHVGDLYSTADVHYVMLHCSEKTYSHFPRQDTNNAAIKEFYNGNAHKWGEYVGLGKETILYASWGAKEVDQLFEDACAEDRF